MNGFSKILITTIVWCLTSAATQAGPLPFCQFSVDGGWSNKPSAGFLNKESSYIVRKASLKDKSGIPEIISKIEKSLSISVPIDVYIAEDEDNASATIMNGKKVIIADVDFLDEINSTSKTEWGAIQVLAHEVGHHIAGFDSDSHRGELNADYWSGQVLQRLGAARSASTRAILAVGTDFDTNSHPAKNKRAKIIAQGWDDAAQDYIDYSFCLDCR
jgi:SepF-like predicted cell division protein (DUF552 family)